ncbi:MAG: hypothetical protein M0P47_06085 [Bacteroidales bacterium]|nr:hypothetical protein [Bacteroidales bacterium]
MKKYNILFLSFFFLFLCFGSRAAIIDSSFYGFTIRHQIVVNTPPDTLFKALVNIGKWWNPEHTFSGSSANLSIQPRANGCFCERLENGGSVKHMTVIYYDPPKTLRLQGAIGPLQSMAVNAIMTFLLMPDGATTRIFVTYTVNGYSPEGLNKLATVVDALVGEQIERLKSYSEGQ